MPELPTASEILRDHKPLVALQDYSYSFNQDSEPVLSEVNLELRAGICYGLAGSTGSGKSTLARALKGLLERGMHSGTVLYPEQNGGAEDLGLILQNPQTQLLCSTVGAECAFGLENKGVPSKQMLPLVRSALTRVDLDLPLKTPVQVLSMGQQYRLLLAAFLVLEPAFFILDEPSAQLDPDGIQALGALIARMKEQGLGFLLIDNRPGALEAVIETRFFLQSGRLLSGEAPVKSQERRQNMTGSGRCARTHETDLVVEDLACGYPGRGELWRDLNFQLNPGGSLWLTGPNGIGKSTLCRCLLGFLQPVQGRVLISGRPPTPRSCFPNIGYLFQNPQRQLFENTVFEELSFSLLRAGWSRQNLKKRVLEMLSQVGLEDCADRSPFRLSYGQQHLVALASILAPGPRILLLDDPFAGLDPDRNQLVRDLLGRLNQQEGTSILGVGHHGAADVPDWVDEHLYYKQKRFVRHDKQA